MRVRLIAINDQHPQGYNYNIAMKTRIEECVCKKPEMEITDTAPDIVHVFGPWCLKSEQEIKKCAQLKIPVIFTSSDGILSILHSQTRHPNVVRKIVNLSTIVCVSGPKEHNIIQSRYNAAHTLVIANPQVTSTISTNDFANKISETYQKCIEDFDQSIKADIQKQVKKLKEKDNNIIKICDLLLYAKYQVHRKDLRKQVVDHIVQALMTEPYNEDKVGEDLKALGIFQFAQRMMSVAQQHAALTEGFMPVAAIDDDKTSQIIDILSDNDKQTIQ